MVISLNPQQFQSKLVSLRAKSQQLVEHGDTGMISNSDITLSYSYDGSSALTLTVLQKHSFRAKLAGAGTIEKTVNTLFAAL